MTGEQGTRLNTIEQWARDRCANHDPAHNALHLERVIRVATDILESDELDADRFVTLASCWLHDIVQLPKGTGKPGQPARESASEARTFLSQLGVSSRTTECICDAIASHSFSGGQKPASTEAAILQDADRIDALGAIGIARLWIVASSLGTTLYDGPDPLGLGRSLDDRKFTLDHIQTKLLKLPSTMNTRRGREIAKGRVQFLTGYLIQFAGELGLDDLASFRLRTSIESGQINARIIYPACPTPSVADAARALNVSESQILKTLLFSNGVHHALAIANGQERVRADLLEEATGLTKLKLARPEEVRRITGFEVGAMPPVGHATPLPAIVDISVTELSVAYGGGGSVDSLIEIAPEEIIRETRATVARITQ